MVQIPALVSILSPFNIVIFMLVFTRITGFLQTAPFFSTISMPIMVKVWFASLISFIIFPIVKALNAFILPRSMPEFIILILVEFFIGFLIGFVANIFIEGTRMSGNILSIQTGLSMSEALDPNSGVSSNIISRMYIYLVTFVFLASGAINYIFFAIVNSFKAIPMGVFVGVNNELVGAILVLFAQLFKIAFAIALPIFAVLLISDIILGFMSKLMPQMNIYMVAIPIKIYIGLILILTFLGATAMYMNGIVQDFMGSIGLLFN